MPEQSDAAPAARFFGRRPKLQSPNEALQPETPPPPPTPHRRRPALSALSGFLSFLLIVSVAGLIGVGWGAHRLQVPGPLPADKVLYIAPGTEVPDIVASLEDEGIIDSPLVFNVALLVEGNRSRVKAGEYLFKQNASMREVMDTLVSGKQILHAVTVPEGLTSEQVVDLLRKSDLLLGDINEIPKEGSLLPETYKIARGMSRVNLIKWMQEDDKKLVEQIWSRRAGDLTLRSPHELVTLASIVEKETGKADERPLVAAVFLNRLQKRMRLQSDPTIVYGIVGGKGTLGRPLLRSDIDTPSPYNTYSLDGLPPGPIANPGRAALEAVANPSRTQDLYFVADGTGGHVFSETLEQHQRNVARWRQIEKATNKSEPDIDKYSPQPSPGRSNQHTDIDGNSVYGALPSSFESADANAQAPTFGIAPAAAAVAAVSPTMPDLAAAAQAAPQPASKPESASSLPSAYTGGPSLDDLGISVRGAASPAAAAKLLDGPIDSSDTADNTTADGDAVKGGPAAGKIIVHPRIFDASEGTALDPLRDTTYDLNYAKTVPPPSEFK